MPPRPGRHPLPWEAAPCAKGAPHGPQQRGVHQHLHGGRTHASGLRRDDPYVGNALLGLLVPLVVLSGRGAVGDGRLPLLPALHPRDPDVLHTAPSLHWVLRCLPHQSPVRELRVPVTNDVYEQLQALAADVPAEEYTARMLTDDVRSLLHLCRHSG